jgi:glycerol uptake facilitator-like aquaporin
MKIKLWSEFIGTAFLTMIVFGSGIMGVNLSQGNTAIALLANTLATGAGLFVLIQCLGPVSGAHLNPVVTLVEMLWGRISNSESLAYIFVQFLGAIFGTIITHLMFNLPIMQISTTERFGVHLWVSEFVATFGLICVIALAGKKHVEFAPMSVAAFIMSGYWFTSSTCFSNPAITFARIFTDTFAGMAPNGFIAFVIAQVLGALVGFFLIRKI